MYTKSNAHVLTQSYWGAVQKLLSLNELAVEDKLTLVRFRGVLTTEIEAIMEAVKGVDKEDHEAVMKKDFNTEIEPVNVPLEQFNSEELYQLEGLIKLGE